MLKGGGIVSDTITECVFSPAIKCEGDTEPRTGSSELVYENGIERAKQRQNMADKIDPLFEYHTPWPHVCKIGDLDGDITINTIKNCNMVKSACRVHNRNEQAIRSGFRLLQHNDESVILKTFLETSNIQSKSLTWKKQFIFDMANLFKGLSDIESNKLIFSDLNSSKITYNETTKRFNFSLIESLTKQKNITKYADFSEFKILYLRNKMLPLDILFLDDKTAEHFKTDLDTLLSRQFERMISKFFEDAYDHFKLGPVDEYLLGEGEGSVPLQLIYGGDDVLVSLHDNFIAYSHKQIQNMIIDKMHVYLMGIVLMECLNAFTGEKYDLNSEKHESTDFLKQLDYLIFQMIHPSPFERYSIGESIDFLNRMMIDFDEPDLDFDQRDPLLGEEYDALQHTPSPVAPIDFPIGSPNTSPGGYYDEYDGRWVAEGVPPMPSIDSVHSRISDPIVLDTPPESEMGDIIATPGGSTATTLPFIRPPSNAASASTRSLQGTVDVSPVYGDSSIVSPSTLRTPGSGSVSSYQADSVRSLTDDPAIVGGKKRKYKTKTKSKVKRKTKHRKLKTIKRKPKYKNKKRKNTIKHKHNKKHKNTKKR